MLTNAQQQTLKTYIMATPALAASAAGNDYQSVADGLNAVASPAFKVWKSTVTADELRSAIINTVAASTQLDALTASKRDSLLWAISQPLNPNGGVSAALDDFCGSQNNLKATIQAALKRAATVAEKQLATGTGTDPSPATLGWEGAISAFDIGPILAA